MTGHLAPELREALRLQPHAGELGNEDAAGLRRQTASRSPGAKRERGPFRALRALSRQGLDFSGSRLERSELRLSVAAGAVEIRPLG